MRGEQVLLGSPLFALCSGLPSPLLLSPSRTLLQPWGRRKGAGRAKGLCQWSD